MNGIITLSKADYVSETINFFNSKDTKKPIFLIIDFNLGGSVWAGLKICDAIKRTESEIKQQTKAPVYVVITAAAASMAAIIAAVAENPLF